MSPNPKNKESGYQLGEVSQKWDINHDGKLDDVEQKLRALDSENLGHLSNEKVYQIMRDQIDVNHKLFNMKRIVMVLSGLVALLAVSNLGTAWAAYVLAKDTNVDKDSGDMKVKGTDKSVAVLSAEKRIPLTDFEANDRRLDGCDGDDCHYTELSGQLDYRDSQDIHDDVMASPAKTVTITLTRDCGNDVFITMDVVFYNPVTFYNRQETVAQGRMHNLDTYKMGFIGEESNHIHCPERNEPCSLTINNGIAYRRNRNRRHLLSCPAPE